MKANISSWTNKESSQQVGVRQFINICRDVDGSSSHWCGASKAQQTVQVEGRDFRIVTLEVREVEVIR